MEEREIVQLYLKLRLAVRVELPDIHFVAEPDRRKRRRGRRNAPSGPGASKLPALRRQSPISTPSAQGGPARAVPRRRRNPARPPLT
jgi:hypothetical protein